MPVSNERLVVKGISLLIFFYIWGTREKYFSFSSSGCGCWGLETGTQVFIERRCMWSLMDSSLLLSTYGRCIVGRGLLIMTSIYDLSACPYCKRDPFSLLVLFLSYSYQENKSISVTLIFIFMKFLSCSRTKYPSHSQDHSMI